jgi:O-antigen/teichoic acid export membrane protein
MSVPRTGGSPTSLETRVLLSTGLPLFWVASINLVMTWTDILMLGIWADDTSVGIYGIVSRTAMLVGLVLIAVNRATDKRSGHWLLFPPR